MKGHAANTTIEDWRIQAYKHRLSILEMIHTAKSGHPGGSLGIIDTLTVLYEYLNLYPNNPSHQNRDRFVLSAGHLCPALYAVLQRKGFFPYKDLFTLRMLGSPLAGHPEQGLLPGIETTSGPLGQGVGVAVGMALSAKTKRQHHRVVCLASDGEHQEGAVWEAAQLASHHHLGNLTLIIDNNNVQISGKTTSILSLRSLKEKYESFGWKVLEVDAHNFELLKGAFDYLKHKKSQQPLCIIAHSTLGKGVSFMQNNPSWHGRAPNDEEYAQGYDELYAKLRRLHLHKKLLVRGVSRT